MAHPVVHFAIGCKHSAKTQEFYKKLFDWKTEVMGPAAMIAAHAGGVSGHIISLGAWMQDPEGNTVGLWKAKK